MVIAERDAAARIIVARRMLQAAYQLDPNVEVTWWQ
jgi:hypothetical protein